MYIFYEYPKCSTCRKAKAELDQLGLDVESINIKENPPSAQFLKELLEGSDLELKKFFNTSGQSYRSCLLYTSPSPRDYAASRMPSSA